MQDDDHDQKILLHIHSPPSPPTKMIFVSELLMAADLPTVYQEVCLLGVRLPNNIFPVRFRKFDLPEQTKAVFPSDEVGIPYFHKRIT